jgi:hypothetical protein
LVGVEIICLLELLSNISILASVSSRTISVSTFQLPGKIQLWIGTGAFIGIPVAITAGVAALYRMEMPLRALFFYMLVSFFVGVGIPMYLLAAGSLCDSVVTPEVQRMGSAFVCGFTDSLTFFWTLVIGTIYAYLIYIVWSATQEIAEAPYPELMKYSEALKDVYIPDKPQGYNYSMGQSRGAGLPASRAGMEGLMAPSYGAFPQGMGQNPFASGPVGAPQSFIPAPGSNFGSTMKM